MSEYLIKEESLVEFADVVRDKFMDYTACVGLVEQRDNLDSVTIPPGTTSIGGFAFAECLSLRHIIIPDSVTSIGDYAFQNCTSLASIIVPDSVRYIDIQPFYGCSSLIEATTGVCSSGIFYYCDNLAKVTFSDAAKYIYGNFFYECPNLDDIYIKSSTPPTLYDSSHNYLSNITAIHVPVGSGGAYKSATNWANFADYIEEATE